MNRRTFRLALAAVPVLVIGGLGLGNQSATASDPTLEAARDAVVAYLQDLGDIEDVPALTKPVPGTSLRPIDALDVDGVLDAIGAAIQAEAIDSADDLYATLEARSGTAGPVSWFLGCDADCGEGESPVVVTLDGTVLTATVPITLTDADAASRLAFNVPPIAVRDGFLPIDLTFTTTPVFTIDTTKVLSAVTRPESIALGQSTLATLSARLSESVPLSLATTFGIVDLAGTGTVTAATLDLAATLTDPDSTGGLTLDEALATAPIDLVTVSLTPAPTFAGTVAFDTNLLPATPDVSATLGYDGTNVTASGGDFTALNPFKNVTADGLLGGVGQLAAGLQSLTSGSDVTLPFLSEGLATLTNLAQPVIDFVSSQSVVCGTVDAAPPSGPVDSAIPGLFFFCSAAAAAAVKPGSINWTVTGGAVEAPDATHDNGDKTIATSDVPLGERKRARFQIKPDAPGPFVVTATYETDTTPVVVRNVSQPPTTALALADRLATSAGFEDLSDEISYNATTKALEFHLKRTVDIPAGSLPNGTIDLGDKLKDLTGIDGLGAATSAGSSGATLTIGLDDITLDLRFGVLLVDDLASIDPDKTYGGTAAYDSLPRGPQDRFYVGAPASGPFLSIGEATADGAVTLGGTLGFLGVDVTGSFDFEKLNPANPSLSVAFSPPSGGIPLAGGASVPGAVTLRGLGTLDLLNDSTLTPTLNAKFDAALTGKAVIDTGAPGTDPTVLGEGAITLQVDDASQPLVAPNFTVAAGDFTTALDGFRTGDLSDPAALLSLILDGLRTVLASIDVGGDAFEQSIPVLGVSPKDLFAQLESLRNGIDELAGGPGPIVTCGNAATGGAVTGSPDGLTQADGTLAALRCTAQLTKPLAEGTVPTWSVSVAGAEPVVTTGTAAQVGTAVTAATEAVSLTVPASSGGRLYSADQPQGYRVTLSFSDADGPHTAEVPGLGAPTNLQALVDAMTAKLGFPAGFLSVDAVDVTKQGGGTVKALRLVLNAGLCSADREGDPVADGGCVAGDRRPPASLESIPVNLKLDAIGGLAGLSGTGTITTSLLARARLGLAIPLAGNSPGDRTPLILGDSGLRLEASAATDDIGFQANVGPLEFAVGSTVDTDAGTDGVQKGVSDIKVGAGITLVRSSDNAATDALTPAEFFDADFGLDVATGEQDCGEAVDGATTVQLDEAFACAKLAVAFQNAYLGDIGLAAKSFTDFQPAVPQAVLDKLAEQLLSLQFILDTLRELVSQLRESLDGAAADVKLPVVGDVLDAGADVAGKLEQVVTAIQQLSAQVPTGNAVAFADGLETFLFDQLSAAGATGLLRDRNNDDTIDAGDIEVTPSCGGPCAADTPVANLSKLRFDLEIGQGTFAANAKECDEGCTTDGEIPFDVGLDGLPVRATGSIAPSAGWYLKLSFGIDRVKGPFLGVVNGPEAEVAARIGFGESACDTTLDPLSSGGVAALDGFSSNRCLQGTLGFLGVQLRDRGTDPADGSYIGINAKLDLSKRGDPGSAELYLNDLLNGDADGVLSASATADIALRVRTGIKTGESFSLPSVIGVLKIAGSVSISTADGASFTPPSITFDTLYLDLGKTLGEFLGGIVGDIKRITSPFKPVIDTLQAPLPVLSQLAALVGKPPVTLIGLLEAVSGADLSLVKSFLSVLQFINALPDPASGSILVSLGDPTDGGAFGIDEGKAKNPLTPDSAGDLVQAVAGNSPATSLLNELGDAGSGNAMDPDRPVYVDDDDDNRPSTFGVRGLSFPVFDSASNIFKILMGEDVTLVLYEIGTLKATAGFNVTFGPFFIGPVPVSVFIGGSATVKGTFAFGYDTSGIRKVLDGASGEHLLDGIFLSDWDSAGNDVPEITLIGQVQAGAQVDLVVVKAGVEGGIRLTLDLNLHDDDHNGKLYIEEIFQKLSNPICLFDINGALDFFLNFFLEFDFFFFEARYVFEILSIRLLDFSSSCDGSQPPKLAKQSGGVLTLLMGSEANRDERALAVEEINEKFTVRPIKNLTTGKLGYSVTAFGLTQEFGPATNEALPEITEIRAVAGDGDDSVSLTEGATDEDTPVTLYPDAKAVFYGGSGKDVLKGGRGNDVLKGADADGGLPVGTTAEVLAKDVDTLTGTEGDDDLYGGPGNDTLNGDLGTDEVYGGDGDDRANGGAGGDRVEGGSGNDVLDGGPAPLNGPAPTLDGENTLVGGTGNDAITGGPAKDNIYGDTESADCGGTAETGPGDDADTQLDVDTVDGGEGPDVIYGGPGGDQLTGGPAADLICGNGGRDILEGDSPTNATNPGGDDLDGGPDNDVLFGRLGNDTLKGAGGNDRLIGDAGNDKQVGGAGNDVLDGAAGLDILLGDDGTIGTDAITADFSQRFALAAPANAVGSGQFNCSRAVDGQGRLVAADAGTADCVYGGGDNDIAFGDGGGDYVAGDDGDDYLDGGKGVDEMRGGLLNDTMFGREGDDDIFGDSGDDLIEGNEAVDEIRGGQGDDQIEGNQGADLIYGDSGQDNIAGGSDAALVDDGGDTIFGGTEADTITGDNALIVRAPGKALDEEDASAHARAVTLYDLSSTETSDYGPDTIQGGDGNDRVYGQGANDGILGGTGRDRLFGNEQVDTIRGELGDDLIVGGSEYTAEAAAVADEGDLLFGGVGDDRIAGDNGSLSMTTGAFTPNVNEGAAFSGNDQIRGDEGLDVIYGQLEDDTIHGDAGQDRIIGDLGTVSATVTSTDPDGVPVSTVGLIKPNVGGVDTIFGDGDADRIWAGAASDTVEGNGGNDYLEGNGGEDFLYGFDATIDDAIAQPSDVTGALVMALGDDDDILGGSSPVNPGPRLDEGENLIQGNGGHDVVLGDNGTVTRPITAGAWTPDTIQGGLLRTIVLDDTDKDAAALDPVSGPDTIEGNDGSDEVFAEGGDDTVFGNDGDDVLVGNQDSDEIRGGNGQDDVVGGSLGGTTASVSADNPRGLVAQGQLDDDDRLYGDAGADVVTGDNAQVIRPTQGSPWETDPVTLAGRRDVTLWDVQRGVSDTFSGNDLALGGPGIDRIMGQDGTDTLKGNEDADFIQGNQDRDLLEGNGGEDDLIGGHRIANLLDDADVIHGGEGADVAIGDNGVIDRDAERTLGAPGNYYYETKQLFATKRFVQLYDVNSADSEIAGGDQVSGGSQVDVLFGQGENDFVFGGADDDYLEGNSATDFMFGDKTRLEVLAAPPAQMGPLPTLPATLPREDGVPVADGPESAEPLLSGALSPDGQDDLIGGSSKDDRLDARDFQYGNGAADFLLGDNGRLDRTITDAAYLTYSEYDGADFRASLRFCTTGGQTSATCQPALRFGGDYQSGDAGNDRIWGQDGDDEQYGGTEHDDLYGELGKDRMFGQDGEDALLGDRGRIADKVLGPNEGIADTTQGPTFFDYAGRFEGQLDRRVDLTRDVDLVKGVSNNTLVHPGMTEGGDDFMRGGRGHDSLHGAFGDDVMNGDSGGDYLFGHDGGDAIWGGKGSDDPATPNATEETGTPNAAVGWTKDNLIDIVFGGYGGSSSSVNGTFTGGSDIIDWRPRPTIDPLSWLEITDTQNDVTDPTAIGDNQHHQGVDWIYGGYNRDVMQGNVGVNGPEDYGDRLLDWTGAYNLYSRCNASYGDDGDVRQHSPDMQDFLQKLAYGSGAGNVLGDLLTRTTSGGREMALVYPGDKDNSGKAYPGTPGNFDKPNCNAP